MDANKFKTLTQGLNLKKDVYKISFSADTINIFPGSYTSVEVTDAGFLKCYKEPSVGVNYTEFYDLDSCIGVTILGKR